MRRRDVKDGEMSPEEQIDNHADRNKMNERTGRRKKGERRGRSVLKTAQQTRGNDRFTYTYVV